MERECNKCIHHTSGTCSSWDCKMQTVEDVKREAREKAIEEFKEAVVAELEKQAKQYHRRAEEHKGYDAYNELFSGKALSYEHAIEIVRGKE